MKESRRDFIKKSGGCALGMVSLATQMHHLGAMSAMAQKVIDSQPEGGNNYKALVLLFFSGGNDGNNMVIQTIVTRQLATMLLILQPATPKDWHWRQNTLLPISVPRLRDSQNNPLTYGMHPSLGPAATGAINNGIHELYGMGDLAIVTNVGTLVRPLTKAQYLSSSFKKPYQLFSHSDQVAQSQTANSNTQAFTGWGGRIADRLTTPQNPNGLVPMITSIAGAQLFTAGQTTLPLAIADSNTPLANVLAPAGFGNVPYTGTNLARFNAFNALRQQDISSNFIKAASHVTDSAILANAALQTPGDVTVTFPNTSIGRQLRQIARLVKKRQELNVNRQVFYCQIGGFDTHTGELAGHINLFSQFSQAMRAFYDEMVVQGVSNDVTTFTLSDFNRTFNPAGSGTSVGSDHAWGNHMFVMGGGVSGGDFYGSKRPDGTGNYYPTLLMGNNAGALDDGDNNASGRGRWIPTTSVEQYTVRLARWFGLQPADEIAVFPNLANFNDTQTALGFLP